MPALSESNRYIPRVYHTALTKRKAMIYYDCSQENPVGPMTWMVTKGAKYLKGSTY